MFVVHKNPDGSEVVVEEVSEDYGMIMVHVSNFDGRGASMRITRRDFINWANEVIDFLDD